LEEDIVVVEIIRGNLKFIATSIYLDIENEISVDIHKIENILLYTKGRGLFVAMDSNARSKTWHDTTTNRRGRLLEEFLISNRLRIVTEDSELTFESNRGTSNVDLTVVDSTIVTLINTWQCNEQESFSDHRYITFRIGKHKVKANDFNYHGVKYITSEEGFKRFDNNFITEIKNNFKIRETLNLDNILHEIPTLETDIENAVEKYQNSIAAASKKSFKERKLLQKTIGYKSVPWWTRDLTIMRKKINSLRRRYQ
jgi:hypothetical protein